MALLQLQLPACADTGLLLCLRDNSPNPTHREESDGKVNTNLVEQKMRLFSTKVRATPDTNLAPPDTNLAH